MSINRDTVEDTRIIDYNYLSKTTAYTAVANDYIYCNSTSAVFTITLPSTPTVNDEIVIQDVATSFNTNNVTLAYVDEDIMGLAEDIILDIDDMYTIIKFTGTDWRLS